MIGLLFSYDWDTLGFDRLARDYRFDEAGFDLFSFPSNARLIGFALERFAARQARRGAARGWAGVCRTTRRAMSWHARWRSPRSAVRRHPNPALERPWRDRLRDAADVSGGDAQVAPPASPAHRRQRRSAHHSTPMPSNQAAGGSGTGAVASVLKAVPKA